MSSTTMLKVPVNKSFLNSSLRKAFAPLTTTTTSVALMEATSDTSAALITRVAQSPLLSSTTRSSIILKRRSTSFATPFSLWVTVTLACLTVLTAMNPVSTVDAAPGKHTLAPDSRITSMPFSISDSSPLPLQLQIEAQVAGKQQLAYLPTTGPNMDFYYLNYRPVYKAGESDIDFWMLTPKGTTAPNTGSLELYDEFGKVLLAVLVPEGTEIPQATANKNEPFLWKSWTVPKTLPSDFDFSEKFRVVLRTSDLKTAATITTAPKTNKRWFEFIELVVKGKNKHVLTPDNANTLVLSQPNGAVIGQDRRFHIKGLQATPGGKPNPAKVNINSVNSQPVAKENGTSSAAVAVNPNTHTHTHTPNTEGIDGSSGQTNIRVGDSANVSNASSTKHALSLVTLVAIVVAAFFDL